MSNALAVVHDDARALDTPRPSLGLLRPIAPAADVLVAQEATRALVKDALKEGRDYGMIPGIDKPSLLKPGAERVSLAFGCSTRFRIVEREVDHDRVVQWVKRKKIFEGPKEARRFVRDEETNGTSLGLYRYVVECEIVHRESGQVVGACLGTCSSMESKYIDRPRDTENTILKMAEKRAMVGATLTTFGLSEQFTQDVEDLPRQSSDGDDEPAPGSNAADPEGVCPKCGGRMWDNRLNKTNPKAPDYKCRDKACDGVFWPGQWPPKPDATPEQRTCIAELMGRVKLSPKKREKLQAELDNTETPMPAHHAAGYIDKLTELLKKEETATAPAAPAVPMESQSTKDELPF
jgi:hypothetical protein